MEFELADEFGDAGSEMPIGMTGCDLADPDKSDTGEQIIGDTFMHASMLIGNGPKSVFVFLVSSTMVGVLAVVENPVQKIPCAAPPWVWSVALRVMGGGSRTLDKPRPVSELKNTDEWPEFDFEFLGSGLMDGNATGDKRKREEAEANNGVMGGAIASEGEGESAGKTPEQTPSRNKALRVGRRK